MCASDVKLTGVWYYFIRSSIVFAVEKMVDRMGGHKLASFPGSWQVLVRSFAVYTKLHKHKHKKTRVYNTLVNINPKENIKCSLPSNIISYKYDTMCIYYNIRENTSKLIIWYNAQSILKIIILYAYTYTYLLHLLLKS